MAEEIGDYGRANNVSSLEERRVLGAQRAGAGGLKGGDGGGMDVRVAKLEREVGDIKNALARLEPAISGIVGDTKEIKGRITQMPSTWQLIGLVIAIFGLAFLVLRLGPPTPPPSAPGVSALAPKV